MGRSLARMCSHVRRNSSRHRVIDLPLHRAYGAHMILTIAAGAVVGVFALLLWQRASVCSPRNTNSGKNRRVHDHARRQKEALERKRSGVGVEWKKANRWIPQSMV